MDIPEGVSSPPGLWDGGPDPQEAAQVMREPQGVGGGAPFLPTLLQLVPFHPRSQAPQLQRVTEDPFAGCGRPGEGGLGFQGLPSHLPAL